MAITASNENFSAYFERVRGAMPEGFEQGLVDEGLSLGTTAYIYVSFMNSIKSDYCTSELVRMNGIEAT